MDKRETLKDMMQKICSIGKPKTWEFFPMLIEKVWKFIQDNYVEKEELTALKQERDELKEQLDRVTVENIARFINPATDPNVKCNPVNVAQSIVDLIKPSKERKE